MGLNRNTLEHKGVFSHIKEVSRELKYKDLRKATIMKEITLRDYLIQGFAPEKIEIIE